MDTEGGSQVERSWPLQFSLRLPRGGSVRCPRLLRRPVAAGPTRSAQAGLRAHMDALADPYGGASAAGIVVGRSHFFD
jgi:hypothetical protein